MLQRLISLGMINTKKSLQGVKTGFHELDRNIVQLNYSEVSLLSGSNSSGKSSWLNTLLLNVIQQGVPSALWSGELPPQILKAWIQMVAAGKNNLKPSSFGDIVQMLQVMEGAYRAAKRQDIVLEIHWIVRDCFAGLLHCSPIIH